MHANPPPIPADAFSPSPHPTGGNHDVDGASAIEIAAMLGDSVVGVRYLHSPRGGRIKAASYALLAAGGCLLALALFAFLVAVESAAHNQRSLHQFTEVEGKSASDWRPSRISPAWDAAGLVGLAGGVALLVLGAGRARRERVSPSFRIGRAAGVDHATDDVPEDSFELVGPRGDRFALSVAPGMRLERLSGAEPVAIAEPDLLIEDGARYRVTAGQSAFLVSAVPPPRTQPTPLLPAWDRGVVESLGASIIAHLALVALLETIAPNSRALNDDPFGVEGRMTLVRTQPAEDRLAELVREDGDDGGQGGQPGTAMVLDSGVMGKKSSNRPEGRYQMKKRAETQELSREKAVSHARTAGILGVYAQNPQMFASLTGTADFSSGHDAVDVYGGLKGTMVGEMAGGWGYGVDGVGPGGGGPGWGTVGRGRWGLIGTGGSCGRVRVGCAGIGPGGSGIGLAKRQPKGPDVAIGMPHTTGDLDRNIIRRYIRRKLPQIRHCYERELMVKQDLAGTVLVEFQISPGGVVQGMAAGGLGHAAVEGCVAEAVGAIQFPKPTGGGFVNVRYPFVFQPAG
jgi:hypothetical protein